MAGASAERQESGVIRAINDAVRKNKRAPITIVAGSTKLSGIIEAKKYAGRQQSGSEPYTDVILMTKRDKINLSLKGEAAPSLAGGGLRGLNTIVPGIVEKFMKTAYEQLIDMGLKDGDKVPDVYGRISKFHKEKIVVGNAVMGGPIDYMYIGPMDVRAKYDTRANSLLLNGNLIESSEYAATHELYFRLRARREDQTFDSTARQAGVPKIYGKSPSRGDSAGRIVVTDRVPSNAIIVKL